VLHRLLLGAVCGALILSGTTANADPPPLKVLKLKPAKKTKASTLEKDIKRLLIRITDDRTDLGSDRQDFESLVDMGNDAVPILGKILRDSEVAFDQRWVCARALGKIGGPDVSKRLRTTVTNERFSMVRLAAISALGDMSDQSAVPTLVKALDDDAMVVRSAAADTLADLGDTSAAPHRLRSLERKDNYYKGRSLWVRQHIVAALGQLRSREAVPKLIELLDDDDTRVGREAIRSLERVTKLTFRVPDHKKNQYAEAVVPKWKAWWDKNKSDFL
jgi:HEAT repeat protein